ncbi:hypothetical protein XENOCAPTIV_011781 [Xenoophorus captivus]|uniref:Uncharacterized protein n=1 Tax=Xenoophorus captivus TaxID=1517983 RepID=A0ABV0Q519_9TELE
MGFRSHLQTRMAYITRTSASLYVQVEIADQTPSMSRDSIIFAKSCKSPQIFNIQTVDFPSCWPDSSTVIKTVVPLDESHRSVTVNQSNSCFKMNHQNLRVHFVAIDV